MSTFIKSAYPLPRKGCALFYPTPSSAQSISVGSFLPVFENTSYKDSLNIIINSSSQIVLKANKKYRMSASIACDMTGAAGYQYYSFYNVTSSSNIGIQGECLSATWASTNGGSNPVATAIIAPTVDTTISLKVIASNTPITGLIGTNSFVEIEELEAYLPASTGTQNINGNVVATGSVSGSSIVDTNLSTGSIPFSISGVLSQDNANLFWDNTNKRLGIGNSNPDNLLTIGDNNATGKDAFFPAVKLRVGRCIYAQTGTARYSAFYPDMGNFQGMVFQNKDMWRTFVGQSTLSSLAYTSKDNTDNYFVVNESSYSAGMPNIDSTFTIGSNTYTVKGVLSGGSSSRIYVNEPISGEADTGTISNLKYSLERMRIAGDGLVTIQNYTQLGSDAPSVKMKRLTGTTASTQGGAVTIAHNLTSSKIISVSTVVSYHIDRGVLTEYSTDPGYQHSCYFNEAHVVIQNSVSNSSNILSKPCIVTIFYIA